MLHIGTSILWDVADDQPLGIIVEQVLEKYGEVIGVSGKRSGDVVSGTEHICLSLLELSTRVIINTCIAEHVVVLSSH